MKAIGLILSLFLMGSLTSHAQTIKPSDHFTIEGEIEKPVDIGPAQLKNAQPVSLDSLVIYSHDMKPKNTFHHLKGVLLKDILSQAVFNEKNPKIFSTIYIKCVATDGYTVLFSWNEIFNTETGDHAMIITEKDGAGYTQQNDRIALISPTDKATGRRYVKSLDKIVIQSVK